MKRTTRTKLRNNRAILNAIEPLEARRLMTVDFFGTSGSDTIEISATGSLTQVRINGGPLQQTSDTDINIHAGDGNDFFRVTNTRNTNTVLIRALGEGGNDTCQNVGVQDLDATYTCPLIFFGGTGSDTYFAFNQADSTTAVSIDVFATGITKVNQTAISLFDEIEELQYFDSDASNRISFSNMRSGNDHVTNFKIFAGGGNDTITNINSADTVGFWSTCMGSGGATIDGGFGTNTLLLNSHNTPNADYIFDTGTLDVNAPGVNSAALIYSNFQALDFGVSTTIAGGTADDVILNGKSPNTAFSFDSGNGDDSWLVGGNDIDTSGFLLSSTTLNGGSGTDFIRFADSNDAGGGVDTYTLTDGTLSKGAAGFNYSGFETQHLITGDAVPTGSFATPNVVNINALSNTFTDTQILGGIQRPCAVTVTQGNLANIRGVLSLSLGATGSDSVTINDQALSSTAYTYDVLSNQVRKFGTGHEINYSGLAALVLNTSNSDDFINVKGLPASTALTVNANNGIDRITLGNGNLDADVLHAVTINGGGSGNLLTINNSLDAAVESQTLTTTDFTDGLTHSYTGITSFVVNDGPGGSTLVVASANLPTTINGGAGDDTINIGNGSLVAGIGANLFVNANGGNDTLLLLGQNDSGSQTYAFTTATQFRFGDTSTGKFVNFTGFEQCTLQSGTGGDDILVSASTIPISISSGAGNDSITVNASAAPITVNTGAEQSSFFGRQGDALSIGSFLGTGLVIIPQSDTLVNIVVNGGSTLRLTNGAILNKVWPTGFFIDFGPNLTGMIDLGTGALLWHDGGGTGILPDFRSMLTRGRSGGAWNGLPDANGGAINSSAAASSSLGDGIGYGFGSEIAATSIGGLSIAPGDMLLRYTLDGDADLNGAVGLSDFTRVAARFGLPNSTWINGDFDYNGTTQLSDFTALAGNFGTAIATATPRLTAGALSSDLDAVTTDFGKQESLFSRLRIDA